MKQQVHQRTYGMMFGLSAGFVLALAPSAVADEARWTNATDSSPLFFDTANWQDGSGQPLGDYPTNGQPLVLAAYPSGVARQDIVLSTNAAKTVAYNQANRNWTLGTVTDNLPADQVSRRTLAFCSTASGVADANWMNVTLTGPDAFAGFWSPVSAGVCFKLLGATTLQNVYPTAGRFRVEVAGNASASIGRVSTGGAIIEKTGTGTLVIDDAGVAGDTSLILGQGTVSLQAGEEELPAGAVLHLDATRRDSLMTYAGTDGREYVKRWNSCNGSGLLADNYWDIYPQGSVGFTNAFIAPVTANGNRLIDFGALNDEGVAQFGPKCGILKINSNKSEHKKVREIFYAGYYTQSGENLIVGNDSTTDFVRYSTLAGSYCTARVKNGDVIYNGRKRPNTYTPGTTGEPYTKMHVWSVGGMDVMDVTYLGSDRKRTVATGGCRIGEVIAYTNALTHAERLRIHRYLMRKWMGAEAPVPLEQAADQVVVRSDSASLDVPADKSAAVAAVRLQGASKLVKTGAGVLKIAAIEPSTAVVDVQGGSVAFGSTVSLPDVSAPAGTPDGWFDASVRSSFAISNNAEAVAQGAAPTNFVTRWNDCRAAKTVSYLTMPVKGSNYTQDSDAPASLPYLREKDANGLDTLSFGVDKSDRSWMIFNGGPQTREGFVVVRHVAERTNIPTLNTTGGEFLRLYCANGKYLNTTYASGNNCAGRWAKNGVAFDPVADGAYDDVTTYHVLNFATAGANRIWYLCKDRTGQGTGFGRQDIAEIILYSRELSPSERYQTEAYLMKKWLDRDHPLEAAPSVGTLSFAAGQDKVVESDSTLAVAAVTGGNGHLVKRGAGSATVASHAGVSDIIVEAGTLTTSFDSPESEALFHFDALDFQALTIEANGGVSNVTEWADVRRNGVKATAVKAADNALVRGLPQYRAETLPNAQSHAVVSFGKRTDEGDSSTAAMKLSTSFTNVREAHTIYRNYTWGKHQNVFTAQGSCNYLAGAQELLWTAHSSPYVNDGYIAYDGIPTNATFKISTGWHHMAFGPTGNTTIDTLALDRTTSAGGCMIGETIAFSRNLTDAERDYLQRKWAYKWFGEGTDCRYVCSLSSVTLGDGATFANAKDVDFTVPNVTANGSSRFEAGVEVSACLDLQDATTGVFTVTRDLTLGDGAYVRLDAVEEDGFDRLSVGGALHLKGALTIDFAATGRKALSAGEHVVCTAAGGIDGFDAAQVRVQLPETARCSARVLRRGNDLIVEILPSGSVLIVR